MKLYIDNENLTFSEFRQISIFRTLSLQKFDKSKREVKEEIYIFDFIIKTFKLLC